MTTEKDSFDQPFAEMEATEEQISEDDLFLIEMGITPRLSNAYKKMTSNKDFPIFSNNELTKTFFDFYCDRCTYEELISIKQDKLPQALANEIITVKQNYAHNVKKVEEGVNYKLLLKWLYEFMNNMSYCNLQTLKTKIDDGGFGVKTREKLQSLIDESVYKTNENDVAKLTEIEEVLS